MISLLVAASLAAHNFTWEVHQDTLLQEAWLKAKYGRIEAVRLRCNRRFSEVSVSLHPAQAAAPVYHYRFVYAVDGGEPVTVGLSNLVGMAQVYSIGDRFEQLSPKALGFLRHIGQAQHSIDIQTASKLGSHYNATLPPPPPGAVDKVLGWCQGWAQS